MADLSKQEIARLIEITGYKGDPGETSPQITDFIINRALAEFPFQGDFLIQAETGREHGIVFRNVLRKIPGRDAELIPCIDYRDMMTTIGRSMILFMDAERTSSRRKTAS